MRSMIVSRTYVDYVEMRPLSLQVSIKESNQLGETAPSTTEEQQGFLLAKEIVKDKGERKKKLDWDILPYSQNG